MFFIGFAIFRGIKDYEEYINERYFYLIHNLFADKTSLKLFVLIDVWLKSFLFRATFILDVMFALSIQREIWKRQRILTDLVHLYVKMYFKGFISYSSQIVYRFSQTHQRLRNAMITFDQIYSQAMVIWFLFFLMYLMADINNFIINGIKGMIYF